MAEDRSSTSERDGESLDEQDLPDNPTAEQDPARGVGGPGAALGSGIEGALTGADPNPERSAAGDDPTR